MPRNEETENVERKRKVKKLYFIGRFIFARIQF